MILLWLIVTIFSASVMAMLMFPLLRPRDRDVPARAAYDLTVYKDQLAEIERDMARGLLTEDQAAAARLEVQRRMLAVSGADGGGRGAAAPEGGSADAAGSGPGPEGTAEGGDGTRPALEPGTADDRDKDDDPARIRLLDLFPRAIEQGPWGIATLAGILGVVPMGSLALYLIVGSPWLPGQPHAQRVAQVEQEQLAGLPAEQRAEIETLRAVVAGDPDEADAWLDLGRAYRRADQHERAVEALEKARALGSEAANEGSVLAELAESRVLTHQGRVTESDRALFLEALRADPAEPRARFYLGMAAAQAGEPERALAIWRNLSADSEPDAPWMGMLRQSMAMVAQQNNILPVSVVPAHPLDLEAGAPVRRVDPGAASDEESAGADPGARLRAESDAARMPGTGFTDDEKAMVRDMVEGLAARLEENPNDPDGWLRLARSYSVLGRRADAAMAANRAVAEAPEDPAVLVRAADILVADAQAAGEPRPPETVFPWFETVLKMDPDHPKALYFVGLSAAQTGEYARARQLWGRLLESMPEDQPAYAAIRRQLEALPEAGITQ